MRRHLLIILFFIVISDISHAQQFPNKITGLSEEYNPGLHNNIADYRNKDYAKSLLKSIDWQYKTYKSYDAMGNPKEFLNFEFDRANNTLSTTYKIYQQGIWIDCYFQSVSFNEEGNILSLVIESWEKNVWKKYFWNYTYEDNQNLISEQTEYYINNNCQDKSNKIYSYGENQKIQSTNEWHWHDNQWIKCFIETYTYDSNNNLKEKCGFNLTSNEFYSKNTYSYDSIGRLLIECRELCRGSIWNKDSFQEYSYDEQGNIATSLREYWYENKCVERKINKYAYDNRKNIIADTLEHWNEYNGYSLPTFSTYNYDANNNLLSEIYWYINHNHVWSAYCQFIYTYDSLDNSLNGFYQLNIDDKWQPADNHLRIFIKGYNIYSSIIGSRYEVTQIPYQQNENNIFIYPNPSKGVFCIEINESFNNTYDLKIVNSINQIVYQLDDASNNKLLVNLPDLVPGIYFIHLNFNDKEYLKKIIIQNRL